MPLRSLDACAFVLAAVACNSGRNASSEQRAVPPARAPAPTAAPVDAAISAPDAADVWSDTTPLAIAAWKPHDALAPWQGAWFTFLSPGDFERDAHAALEISGTSVRATVGGAERTSTFVPESACSIELRSYHVVSDGSTEWSSESRRFVIDADGLRWGEGAAGLRRGRTAIACEADQSIDVLDDSGACVNWKNIADSWLGHATSCAWSTEHGTDVLTIASKPPVRLIATGDVLTDAQFDTERGRSRRMPSYAAAKAAVIAADAAEPDAVVDDEPPGVVGDLTTVRGLFASFKADTATVGKRVTISGWYFSTSREIDGPWRLAVVDHKNSTTSPRAIDCEVDGVTPGFVTLDRITVTGTVSTEGHHPYLAHCTVKRM